MCILAGSKHPLGRGRFSQLRLTGHYLQLQSPRSASFHVCALVGICIENVLKTHASVKANEEAP